MMSQERITVSVIIPTYNRSATIKRAVDSVFNQTYKNFELIIIDDGSSDKTESLLKDYFSYSNFIYKRQKNSGVASARNHGIQTAKAEWIAFLDSDDEWLPEKLETQVRFHRNNPILKVSQTEEIWIRKGRRVNPMKKHSKPSGWIFESCVPLCLISPSAVMIHRDVFDRVGVFDEKLPACEDYDLWLRLTLDYRVQTLDKPLIKKYGGHDDQLSQKYWGMDLFRLYTLKKIQNHPRLDSRQKKLLEEDMKRREAILRSGYEKRGKVFNYQKEFERYSFS